MGELLYLYGLILIKEVVVIELFLFYKGFDGEYLLYLIVFDQVMVVVFKLDVDIYLEKVI